MKFTIRRIIIDIIIIIITFILQASIFDNLKIATISPNLMIFLTSAYGFMRGKREGLLVGLFSGLLLDVFYGSALGFYALLFMCIGYANGYFNKIFYKEDVLLPVGLIAASDFVYSFIVYLILFLFRGRFNFLYYLIHIILPEIIYTVFVAVFLYFLLLRLNGFLEKGEKKVAKKFV